MSHPQGQDMRLFEIRVHLLYRRQNLSLLLRQRPEKLPIRLVMWYANSDCISRYLTCSFRLRMQHATGDGRPFANATSPGMSPHSISPVMGDIVSSSTTSSQTRTVETVTVSQGSFVLFISNESLPYCCLMSSTVQNGKRWCRGDKS